MKTGSLAPAALALGAMLAFPAAAHVTGTSYADIALTERAVRVALRVPARGLAEHMRLSTVSADSLIRDSGGEVARLLADTVQVLNGDRRCIARPPDVRSDSDPERVRVQWAFDCQDALGRVGIHLYVFNEFGPNHSVLAKITRAGTTREFVFTQTQTDFHSTLQAGGLVTQLASFLTLGIEHIFTGYDHILFIVGLLVIWRGALNILKVVTAFTVAHSITLILAALSVLTLPSRLVESVIALSIAYVGIENIFVKNIEKRWRVAFLFGLMHGFGFASVLSEMGLPSEGLVLCLLSFNVGVEVGQLAIVLLLYPLVYYTSRAAYGPVLVRGASAAIVLMGLFWFVQRALLGA